MNTDKQMDNDLTRLGKSMSPGPEFVPRVMERIDSSPPAFESASPRRWWMPISLAAGFLLALGLILVMRHTPSPNPAIDDPSANWVRTTSEWQTVSERAITLEGDIPAREISQQKFERVRWVDPRLHTTFERIVPREKCTFVTLENY